MTTSTPLTIGDRAELLEMVTNTKLLSMKLAVFHNHNKQFNTAIACECANQAVQLQKVSQLLLTISRYHQ